MAKHCTLEDGGVHNDRAWRLQKLFQETGEWVSLGSDPARNNKREFHQAPLTRLVEFTGLHGDQGEEPAGQFFPGLGGLEVEYSQG